MKRITLLAILYTVSVSISFSQDFRKSSWGDSMAEVISVEGSKEWIEIPNDLDFVTGFGFVGNVEGLEAMIGFLFFEDKLYFGKYIFTEQHNTQNSFITDFDRIDKNLQSKYGSTKVEEEWNSDRWKNDRDNWGNAISQGELYIYTQWDVPDETPVTNLNHYLTGGNYEINHAIEYFSVELGKQLDSLLKENVF